jgi:hypothetical protein
MFKDNEIILKAQRRKGTTAQRHNDITERDPERKTKNEKLLYSDAHNSYVVNLAQGTLPVFEFSFQD